jgi:SAM-dependent methyltransferase
VSIWVQPRRPTKEWLDDPSLPLVEVRNNLEDLRLLHRRWGAARTLRRWASARLLAAGVSGRRVRVLDVGAGSGHVAARLQRGLRAEGHRAAVVALDLQWRHLRLGGSMRGSAPRAIAVAGDAFHLPFEDGAFDLVVSTLFFHHFSPPENGSLLREMARVARLGFALLDLRRHRAPALFVSLAGPVLFRSAATVHDGLASVNQAYTVDEALAIAKAAVPQARARRLFPFRWLLTSGV